MNIVPGPFAAPLHGCGMREPDLDGATCCGGKIVWWPGLCDLGHADRASHTLARYLS